MKHGWRTWLCALAVSGLAASARADLVVPPTNDYSWFLHRGGGRNTPELRAEYDRFCIDWYNAHRGDCTGEHSYIYWRKVPRMRKGAPEAVTNAYEWFRKSLKKERDLRMVEDGWDAGGRGP